MCVPVEVYEWRQGSRGCLNIEDARGCRDVPDEWPELLGCLVDAIASARDGVLVAGAVRCLALFVDELGDEQVHQVLRLKVAVWLLAVKRYTSAPMLLLPRTVVS